MLKTEGVLLAFWKAVFHLNDENILVVFFEEILFSGKAFLFNRIGELF